MRRPARARRRREVGGTGGTGHVGVPRRVYSDAEALIKVGAAEIGGVEEGACRVELRDEGVGEATISRPHRARRRRAGGGSGGTGHVGVAGHVDGRATGLVTATAPAGGGVYVAGG